WRPRMDVAELEPDAARHHVLLAAGVDEEEVLLAVVEEAEVLLGRGVGDGALARISGRSSGGESPGPCRPCFWMKTLTRCRVSGVTRAPSRSRATNLPSFTARRPKVDSAMPVRRQNSEMLPNRVPLPATTASIGPPLRRESSSPPCGTSTTRCALQ